MPTITSTNNKGCLKLGSARANSSIGLFLNFSDVVQFNEF